MRPLICVLTLFVSMWPAIGHAQSTLEFPASAILISDRTLTDDSYDVPIAPWSPDGLPVTSVEGDVSRQIWRIPVARLATLQILAPLREQLVERGFDILFECRSETCGGFDFRFAADIEPAPDMLIDLADFRYLAAADGDTQVALYVSRTNGAGYVQSVTISGGSPVDAIPTPAAEQPPAPQVMTPQIQPVTHPDDLATALETAGHTILSDVIFDPGTTNLGADDYRSLAELAAYLRSHTNRQIAVVGHTDSSGSLEVNIAVSRRRAEAVRDRLIGAYGVSADQVIAGGMGFLAPVASNLTSEGREANRRVEAVLISTQ